jgi:hypothetical protein
MLPALFGHLQLLRGEKFRLSDRFRRMRRRRFMLRNNLETEVNFDAAALNPKWIVSVHVTGSELDIV